MFFIHEMRRRGAFPKTALAEVPLNLQCPSPTIIRYPLTERLQCNRRNEACQQLPSSPTTQ